MPADEKIKKSDKEKVIDMAISTIEKQFGKGSIMRLKDTEEINRNIPVISTGLLSLDIALGTGGLPRP
jgi:recombination protein RecA